MGAQVAPSRDTAREMSQENVELARRSFETFNRGGVDAVFDEGLWSPEVIWDLTAAGIPGLGIYRGREEVKSFFEDDWFKVFPFDAWHVQLDEVTDQGDRVIGICRQRGHGAASGVETDLMFVQVATIRNGQFVRIDNYRDREEALKAAGQQE
jgi:ketosteroid isomerase-like protein